MKSTNPSPWVPLVGAAVTVVSMVLRLLYLGYVDVHVVWVSTIGVSALVALAITLLPTKRG